MKIDYLLWKDAITPHDVYCKTFFCIQFSGIGDKCQEKYFPLSSRKLFPLFTLGKNLVYVNNNLRVSNLFKII